MTSAAVVVDMEPAPLVKVAGPTQLEWPEVPDNWSEIIVEPTHVSVPTEPTELCHGIGGGAIDSGDDDDDGEVEPQPGDAADDGDEVQTEDVRVEYDRMQMDATEVLDYEDSDSELDECRSAFPDKNSEYEFEGSSEGGEGSGSEEHEELEYPRPPAPNGTCSPRSWRACVRGMVGWQPPKRTGRRKRR